MRRPSRLSPEPLLAGAAPNPSLHSTVAVPESPYINNGANLTVDGGANV
jgi:hypothetical protein